MFLTKRALPRRTFLRGMGVTLGLPLLESMVPSLTATAKTAANPPRRLGCVYVPHGKIMEQWTPATAGAGFEITPILKPQVRCDTGWWWSATSGPKWASTPITRERPPRG